MTSFDAVDVFDLNVPISVREIGRTGSVETTAVDRVVHGQARSSAYRRRSWEITITDEVTVGRDRALSIYANSGYGALPINFTPPGESEIDVFMELPTGVRSARIRPQHHNFQVILTESK